MTIIDMDMPQNCRECPLRQRSEKYMGENYCMGMLGKPIKSDIFTKRADFCPIKCDIEQIRQEIDELDRHYDNDYFSGNRDAMFKCDEVLQIIDRYKKGE